MSDAAVADIVVIGAGPAGIAAATSAAQAGCSVLLLDEGARPGGQIWRHRERRTLPTYARQCLEALDAASVRMLSGATVIDIDASAKQVFADVDGAAASFRADRAIILCTGARERFLPFPGWTLPGIVGVGGAQALLKQGMDVRGRRVVVAGSGPLLLPVAASLARAGARIALVAEQAPAARVRRFAAGLWRTPARVLDAVRYRAAFAGAPYRFDTWVAAAEGNDRVGAVRITGADGSSDRTLACDLLCVGYGLVPAVELPRIAGCSVRNGMVQVDELQQTTVPGILCAGEPAGIAGMDAAIAQGEIAGLTAAGADVARSMMRRRDRLLRFAGILDRTFTLRAELRTLSEPDTIICRCEDVTLERITDCSGFREARLHTRAGMGPCQGRVCGAALEFMKGWTDVSVRPPVAPVRVGSLTDAAAAPGGVPSRSGGP